jgi:hypothetical protein
MSTDESVLDLVLLNLSVAASLARNRLLLSVPALDDNPYGSAASLIRHIQALEDALRHFDRAASPRLDDDFVP